MSVRVRLVLASALMLFLELALIRWTAANVVHLGYFSNVVLLGSFLGVSLGFLRARRTDRAPLYFPAALGLLVLTIWSFPVTVDRESSDLLFFTAVKLTGPPAWVSLPLVFAAVALVMAGPGELVGRYLAQLPRLEAYRFDLLGSLAGVVAFSALAFLRAPSLVWGLVVSGLTVLLLGHRSRSLPVAVGLCCLLGVLGIETFTPNVSWSPYNKIELKQVVAFDGGPATAIIANGVPHQSYLEVRRRIAKDDLYGTPYLRIPPAPSTGRDVMIIGAGSGTDVSLALLRGAHSVHAVEIDPRIQQIGSRNNPDRPYQDPRVRVSIDDGRAILQNDDRKYDLVIFALPDSLTLVSGASQIRLESYLFTKQSLEAARNRLTEHGSLAMYNYYREPWLVGRLARTAQEVFGHEACVDLKPGGARAVITVSKVAADQTCAGPSPVPAASSPAPVDDDRPFLYLRNPGVPAIYLGVLGGIVLLSLIAVRGVAGPVRRMRPYSDLFFLGAAFLLLETRAVAGFALLFGTTWFVNALVFGGVLVAVLAAVELTRLMSRRPPLTLAYAALAVSLVIAALVPATALLSLPAVPRALAAVVVAFLPIFTANVVFATRFENTEDGPTALGANLLGAILGGCLEYLALVIGYHALVGVAALLYGTAFALGRAGGQAVQQTGAGGIPVAAGR